VATIESRAVIEKILAHLGLPLDPPRPDPARSPEWLSGLSAEARDAGRRRLARLNPSRRDHPENPGDAESRLMQASERHPRSRTPLRIGQRPSNPSAPPVPEHAGTPSGTQSRRPILGCSVELVGLIRLSVWDTS